MRSTRCSEFPPVEPCEAQDHARPVSPSCSGWFRTQRDRRASTSMAQRGFPRAQPGVRPYGPTVCVFVIYDRPHADGSPRGTFGPQSPAPIGSDPLASESGVPNAENGAAVSCRRVPNRSSFGDSYMSSPTGSRLRLAIGTPDSATRWTTLNLRTPRPGVNRVSAGRRGW